MTAMTLTDRLEKGERWDGDNAEALRALGWKPTEIHKITFYEPEPLDDMNAALALVPEGWRTHDVDQDLDAGMWLWMLEGPPGIGLFHGQAPTAAIALTVAILKASQP